MSFEIRRPRKSKLPLAFNCKRLHIQKKKFQNDRFLLLGPIVDSFCEFGLEMRKLVRQFRNSEDDKFSLPTIDDSRPMDTHEQEELVRSLERMHAHQSLQWKSVFAALLFCYSAFLVYSIYQQAFFPWELRYYAYFMEEVDSWIIITADWLAVLACLMAIMSLLNNSKDHRRWIWYSCFLGLVLAVFWLYYMLRMVKFRWDVIWLPLGPLCGAGVCLYVDHLLSESSEEVRKLRSYMYAYKAR